MCLCDDNLRRCKSNLIPVYSCSLSGLRFAPPPSAADWTAKDGLRERDFVRPVRPASDSAAKSRWRRSGERKAVWRGREGK